MWLTAFSQLVSRICHPSPQVQNTLRTILVTLIAAYPQHCLWMMASVFNVRLLLTSYLCHIYLINILSKIESKQH